MNFNGMFTPPPNGFVLPVSTSPHGILCVSLGMPIPANVIIQNIVQKQQQQQQQYNQAQAGAMGGFAVPIQAIGAPAGVGAGFNSANENLNTALRMIDTQMAMFSFHFGFPVNAESINLVKDRYVVYTLPNYISMPFVDNVYLSNVKSIDIYTFEHCLCKIIDEPEAKVRQAYFNFLQANNKLSLSRQYGHHILRPAKDIIPLSDQSSLVITSLSNNYFNFYGNQYYWPLRGLEHPQPVKLGLYEDLCMYVQSKGRLSETEARGLFYQICEMTLNCHRNGVILRDLKMKRFYFVDEGRTMLQYMSLEGAKIVSNPNDDILHEKLGSLYYVAPELLDPNSVYHGKAADAWSLGVILYTLLVGQYPFRDLDQFNLLTVIRHHDLNLPSYLSQSVRQLLSALLQKDPAERIPTCFIFLSPWLMEQSQYFPYSPFHTTYNSPFNTTFDYPPFSAGLINAPPSTNAPGDEQINQSQNALAPPSFNAPGDGQINQPQNAIPPPLFNAIEDGQINQPQNAVPPPLFNAIEDGQINPSENAMGPPSFNAPEDGQINPSENAMGPPSSMQFNAPVPLFNAPRDGQINPSLNAPEDGQMNPSLNMPLTMPLNPPLNIWSTPANGTASNGADNNNE